jgi:hypothetical protein
MQTNKHVIVCVILLVLLAVAVFGIENAAGCKLYDGKLNIVINPPGVSGGSGGLVLGDVGHHMITSTPKATGSKSRWQFTEAKVVGGSIPPGLHLLSNGRFEGTPEQPGHWEAEVVFTNVRCGGNSLGDHYIKVDFYISK